MFKKFVSMATAATLLAAGISAVGMASASAANEKTLTTASKVKGVTATLGTPSGYGGNPKGSVNLTASQAADTSNSGNFVTEFIPTDSQASVVVALYPNATNGMGNPANFPGSYTYNGTDALSNNQLFVIKVTQADNMAYQYYEVAVRIVSTDATLSFANSRLKSVTPGSATAFDDIAQLATSSNRASISLTSTQASSTFGDQNTYFSGAGNNATTTAKKFASSISSLDSNAFSAATTVTRFTAITNGDYIVVKVTAEDATTTKYYGYTVTVGSSGGGSSPSPSTPTLSAAQIAANAAAAAKAAAEAAAAVRAAEIATAQTALSTVLKADKAGTLSEYRSANINITTNAGLTRLNAEVLKLAGADRTDFAKIKALADKIEFDESFFNATARPSLATYSTYGVTGVTERILPTVNAKILELPAALRVDVKAMQDLVKVENFVDRVANTETRSTVSASALVEKGLLSSTSPYKYSVVQGLAKYPEGSLNTMAKIEAAIKEQIAKAEAPKLRLAAIKAKIAARKK